MTGHPNTVAAGLSGGAATLTVWLLNKYAGTHLSATDAAGIATGYAAAVLFVGRNGIGGALSSLWRGNTAPKAKK
jgi:hypothetical protein